MDDQQDTASDLIIFLEDQKEEHHQIRKIWHNNHFYFSIMDIITALQVSQQPRIYWLQLKTRVKDEGFEEAVSRIVQFRLKAVDGRFRLTDFAEKKPRKELAGHSNPVPEQPTLFDEIKSTDIQQDHP